MTGFNETDLLSPDEAHARFIAQVSPRVCETEHVALDDASGRILAQIIRADRDYPDAPRSAMDGFALLADEQSFVRNLVGEVPMGGVLGLMLGRTQCARIPTGGVLPLGADAVIPKEDVDEQAGEIRLRARVVVGENITPQGSDMRADEIMLQVGRRLGIAEVGLLATLGIVAVPVFRRPVFGVLSSGDELVEPATVPGPGQIRDSNRFAIAAALRAMGCEAVHLPSVPDHDGALEAAMRDALPAVDGLVISGGSSVGERDRTPAAMSALGAPGLLVHGLRIKPGKPTVLAAVGAKPIIGLPGNPTSALLVLDAVVAPLLVRMIGASLQRFKISARLSAPLRGRPGWTWYAPVLLEDEPGGLMAHPLDLRSSHVSLAARASGYVTVVTPLESGAKVEVAGFLGGGY